MSYVLRVALLAAFFVILFGCALARAQMNVQHPQKSIHGCKLDERYVPDELQRCLDRILVETYGLPPLYELRLYSRKRERELEERRRERQRQRESNS